MHICIVSSEFPPVTGGVGYYVFNLSKNLVAKGHEVTIITPQRPRNSLKYQVLNGAKIFRVPFLQLYPFHVYMLNIFTSNLFKSLEQNFTIVHCHSPMPLSLKTSLPTLTTVHTPMGVDGIHQEIVDLKSLIGKFFSIVVYPPMEKRLFRRSKITTVSQMVAKELETYGLDTNKISVVGNGVDEKFFTPIKNKCADKYVLYTGVLRARKGLFDFIDCAKIVCANRQDVKFVLCGRGILLSELQKYVHQLHLQTNVIFLGFVSRSKLLETYQNATIHVVPSHYEGLPTVLLEAMSCGLPIVATNIGGSNEVISSEVNGLLVPPKCPDKMAKTVLRLLEDSDLREKLGRAARQTIEENYTWDKITDRIVSFYEALLKHSESGEKRSICPLEGCKTTLDTTVPSVKK